MIEIEQRPDGVSIKGHAGYAPPGQDIVCAAVSVLVQTLCASLGELTTAQFVAHWNEQGQLHEIKYENLSAPGRLLVDSFFIGVGGIAAAYPDNVKILNCSEIPNG